MRAATIVLGWSVLVSASQSPAAPPPEDVERIVARFVETAHEYHRTFRNLAAEETRLNEVFHPDGRLRRKREITADLLVYVSARSQEDTVEYRDVKAVDGKAIGKRDKRALDLVTRAASAKSLEQELQLIARESQRYDFDHHVGGFTVHQALGWNTTLKDFRFDWAGREQLDGHDTLGVTYRQLVPTPEFSGITRLYREMGVTSFFSRGKLWLDPATFQLRRSRTEVAGVHPGLPEPATIMSVDHAYTDSRFGILTPSRIVFEWLETAKRPKSTPAFTLAARTTFTYGEFRRFEVATEESVAAPK